ncbi:MAG: HAMP domain-containing protein [Acidobacteria bacterium]|nr:MAG: HAMP domain-containing protein [Acidobacteriota bacterium]
MLVWLAAPGQVALDRAVNLALLALAALTAYRLTRLARSGLLWRVSRKLVLSYILVGAVPILLLVTFSALAFLLVFFDIGSYLVRDRFDEIVGQASVYGRMTLFEIERADLSAHASIIERRQAAISARHPQASLSLASPEELPTWLAGRGFSGLVEQGKTARAVVLSGGRAPRHAVVVDLPVESALTDGALEASGIRLGEQRAGSLLNTATYLTYVDWETGAAQRTPPVAMSVDVPALYNWLGGDDANAGFHRTLLAMLVGIGVLLLVIEVIALANGLALARTITTSVDELFGGTERVKSGEFDQRIAVRSDDQLGTLAASFNDMTGRIQHLLVEQDEKRRLEQELRIARDIQMSLLPQGTLQAPGLSVAALCSPAREVGGDYYDFLPLADGRIGLIIADVSGKGTSAALYMAELKGLMLSLSRIHTSPRALLVDANRIISPHLDSRSFITMTYAVIDAAAGTLTCARAGHTPFIRIAAHGSAVRRAEVMAPDGMVLGLNLDGGVRFERCLEELTLQVAHGDLLFFFTDGISEAMDARGDCFGDERLSACLEAIADQPPEAIRDRLVEEISAFVQGQPQHDDITMVIVKFNE